MLRPRASAPFFALVLAVLLPLGAPSWCQASPPPAPSGASQPAAADSLRPATASRAMVSTGHPEASRAGLDVLREGGNAVDAAVAIGFALAVVSPDAGNIGGGGFLLARFADGQATSFDFRERAPLAATRTMFLDRRGDPVPERSQRGALAVGVPGTVAGLLDAHARYGRLPLARLLEPAIRLAEGHPLSDRIATLLNRYRTDFESFPSTAAYFIRLDGAPYAAGERQAQPDLAATLRRIQAEGASGFYGGETARLIVAEMQRSGGLITLDDLQAYRAVERPVLRGTYRGHGVLTMGPPSAGGVALLQTLAAVEPYPLRRYGFQSAEAVHLTAEALRRAFADRARFIGDPDFVDVPSEALTDPAYVAARMASFNPAQATPSLEVQAGEPALEPTETTHYSVVDAEGNAVSVTTTLNDYFGSRLAVGGAGFLLNNEMDDFAAAPGRPNLWGLVQGEANAVAPGKRMASSMTPTIVEDPEGRLFMVAGSPGGARIISTVFQALTNVVDFGMNAQEAVARPRFHHQWLPDRLEHEAGVPVASLAALGRKGWALQPLGRFGAANVIVVRYGPRGRTLEGAADPRRSDGDARGF